MPLPPPIWTIRPAQTSSDYEAFGALCREYVEWCRGRYSHDPWFVDRVFGHQDLTQELQGLATTYGPPNGITLLASRAGLVCGGGAYRRLPDGSCEMKRLYVSDRFKGQGIGRALGEALIESARAEGYPVMRLDTANRLTEAITMYHRMGFKECAPHRFYPPELLPYLVFMELSLRP